MTEDEMVGWLPRLNGHEFKQAPRDGEGQESLVCCSPWGHKESDVTEQLSLHFFKHYQNLSHHGYRLEGKDLKQESLQKQMTLHEENLVVAYNAALN